MKTKILFYIKYQFAIEKYKIKKIYSQNYIQNYKSIIFFCFHCLRQIDQTMASQNITESDIYCNFVTLAVHPNVLTVR